MDLTSMFLELLKGLLVSLEIFFLTLLFSLPLGLAIAFGRMARSSLVADLFRLYISIMRGAPLMLQLLVCFFGPCCIFGIPLSGSYRFAAVIIAFSLNYAAYFAAICRAGIQSIPWRQYEAAEVLGFSPAGTFFRIIFPRW